MNIMFSIYKKDKDGFLTPFIYNLMGENYQRMFNTRKEADEYLVELNDSIKKNIDYHYTKTTKYGFLYMKKKTEKVYTFNADERNLLKSYLNNLQIYATTCYTFKK